MILRPLKSHAQHGPSIEMKKGLGGGRNKWQFWIDRGGTFTDIVAHSSDGRSATLKLLSHCPDRYRDAAIAGIHRILGLAEGAPIPPDCIQSVRIGTTVATNALLEKNGAKVVLVITRGFADALRIGDQRRLKLFDLSARKNKVLYARTIEVDERVAANGTILRQLDLASLRPQLIAARRAGCEAAAVVCLHSYRYPAHERQIAALCRQLGFSWVCNSAEVAALIGMVSRGETTVADAYLSPSLRHHVDLLGDQLGYARLQFMQSNGGLTAAAAFWGRNAVLSGPAGGVVGAAAVAAEQGAQRIISFDMGGTSTDVAHWAGRLERTLSAKIAGTSLRVPMIRVHTVAAGGGSLCRLVNGRLRVGPVSARADPGPACYRRGGPLALTDCNLIIGKIQAQFFPSLFGPNHDQPLSIAAARRRLAKVIAASTGLKPAPEELAADFVMVAVELMCAAIKEVSVRRGHDLANDYTLVAFGGAGGQHACLIAEQLGIDKILLHPQAGVLSALGIGLAAARAVRRQSLEIPLRGGLVQLRAAAIALAKETLAQVRSSGPGRTTTSRRAVLRYEGAAGGIDIPMASAVQMEQEFVRAHRKQFGFDRQNIRLIIAGVEVETIMAAPAPPASPQLRRGRLPPPVAQANMFCTGSWHPTEVYLRKDLPAGSVIDGPALIAEPNTTSFVELGWQARMSNQGSLLLSRGRSNPRQRKSSVRRVPRPTPARLEVFHSIFTSVARQMGHVLRNSAASVNIRERTDYSCAVFNRTGNLVANAPHIPVHLGSMGASVRAIIAANACQMRAGDSFLLNSPFAGGTHLPDLTLVSPVFVSSQQPSFFVCSRGHHADIGGLTPGSMPPNSRQLDDEGVVINNFRAVREGVFDEAGLRRLLASSKHPARNPDQNIADLLAQLAANTKGSTELRQICADRGLATVTAFMKHIQDHAAAAVRALLVRLHDGEHQIVNDDGSVIRVRITIAPDKRRATIDFAGTSDQSTGNANAPPAIARTAVCYVLRSLLETDIPLNDGCLRPIRILIPAGSMLNPRPGAAVAAGNVETSQGIVDALLGALGVAASSQGTMNNVTFGNRHCQYYETVCGGAGALPTAPGEHAVHTHMTNSRITDPEVLEKQLPVLVEKFALRRGSGGRGQHRGGDGVLRRLRFSEAVTVNILANRRREAPYGMAGGKPGARGLNFLERRDGTIVKAGARGTWSAEPGDTFELRTPGGGAWGRRP